MNDNILFELFLIFFLLVINGVLMTEIAFVSSRRAKLKRGRMKATGCDAAAILESPTNLLSTIQIAISLVGCRRRHRRRRASRAAGRQLARVPFLRPYSATPALVVVVP